ncbi:MAG: VOC family protein [Bauldia sp.]|uniref:VOC family protein n=1 Tax=Bauldia sp. TaxID=2575872 RepID=UPI001DC226EE|nr:VOC family protein [Bauldia sp.]MCB1495233.1 VOC family protein [Bauldia sp.]
MTLLGIDHIQIEVPVGAEDATRAYYVGLLGLEEVSRPREAAGRSFLWVRLGDQQIHFRCGADFRPAALAHPAFLVDDIDALERQLADADCEVTRVESIAGGRFHTRDPFGNRLEFISAATGEEGT